MEFENILQLIKTIDKSSIQEFSIQKDAIEIKIVKPHSVDVSSANSNTHVKPQEFKLEANAYQDVTSPMVGTYYQASSEEDAPYVQVGDQVVKGQVLCIIEAMKLMNEITSNWDGVIKEIHCENEQMVSYGQKLFSIEVNDHE